MSTNRTLRSQSQAGNNDIPLTDKGEYVVEKIPSRTYAGEKRKAELPHIEVRTSAPLSDKQKRQAAKAALKTSTTQNAPSGTSENNSPTFGSLAKPTDKDNNKLDQSATPTPSQQTTTPRDTTLMHDVNQKQLDAMIDDDLYQNQDEYNDDDTYEIKTNHFGASITVMMSDNKQKNSIYSFLYRTRDRIISHEALSNNFCNSSRVLPIFNKPSRDNNDTPSKAIVGYKMIVFYENLESRDNLVNINFSFEDGNENADQYSFEPYTSAREARKLSNATTQNRTVQIYNASLAITTALLKPFLRRFGKLDESSVYSRRPDPKVPNKQVFYATYEDEKTLDHFYSNSRLWVYNELLCVIPMNVTPETRLEKRQHVLKLNGILPNASPRDFKNFIDEFNVIEFKIPRNTRTDRTQLYAYVYFADEESKEIASSKVLTTRGKRHEWSPHDVKSCYRCGYTNHIISECNYRPPRTRQINKRDYLNSTRRYNPKTSMYNPNRSYADAARSSPRRNNRENPRSWNSWNRRNTFRPNPTNWDENAAEYDYANQQRNEFMEDSIYEWDEPWEEDDTAHTISNKIRNRIQTRGTAAGGSMHERPKPQQQQKINVDDIQNIQNCLAELKDMVDIIKKDQNNLRQQLSTLEKKKGKQPEKSSLSSKSTNPPSGSRKKVAFNDYNKREYQSSSDSDINTSSDQILMNQQISKQDKKIQDVDNKLDTLINAVNNLAQNFINNTDVIMGENDVSSNNNKNLN